MKLRIKLVSNLATVPTRGSDNAAALDLYAAQAMYIPAMSHAVVELGVAVEIPEGYFGLVAQRSGLASRGCDIFGGIIDSDYRGTIKAFIFNGGTERLCVNVGHRVAQLVILPCMKCEVEKCDELTETKRGENGLGSTGL